MEVSVQIKGLAELEARLTEMDALGSQRTLVRVLWKIAKPMADRARSNAWSLARSGALAMSIGIRNRKTGPAGGKYSRGNVVARVSVGSIAKNKTAISRYNQIYNKRGMYRRKGIFYGWMLDQGHRIGTRSTGYLLKRGGSRALTEKGLARWATKAAGGRLKSQNRDTGSGSVGPRRWWTPAVQAEEPRATLTFFRELQAAIRRIEKRKSKTAQTDTVVPQ
jgi:hypothetical protein